MIRFDKPCISATGAVEYFRGHMAVGDYLTEEGQAEMVWVGSGGQRLGLAGQCNLAAFERVCAGRHPSTGDKLMIRDKGARRRVCFFGQISPPKDVSVLHLVGGDQRLGEWWREAVVETLAEMEALTATRVRRGRQNSDRRTNSMVAAIVTHDANRALDPQLHTHVCVMNLTYDNAEGRWKSVQPSDYYRHQGYLREVCYNKLACRMTAAGYELEPGQRIGFAVKGVPPELRELFSKRRREILREAAAVGATTQDALQAITTQSRAPKTKATAASLRAGWIREAGSHLKALHQVVAAASGSRPAVALLTPEEILRSAEAHVFERKSVVDDRLLLREALVASRGQVSLKELKHALDRRERSGALLRIEAEIASAEGLEAEREFTGWANAQLRSHRRLGRDMPLKGLGPDQGAAVRAILRSHSGVIILQGDAGTGKTTCLQTVVAGIVQGGGQVFGCAPSSGATEILRCEVTREADTVQQLLGNEGMQKKLRGRVLIIDEAGLISVRQMRDLCRLAAHNEHRLLLVGDIKQHSSIEAGDALRALQEFARAPLISLTEIRRQKDPAYRQAVARLACGDAFGAFNRFDQLGAISEVKTESALFAAAAKDFLRTVRAGNSCLAISPVWEEIRAFSIAVRAQLRAEGMLAGPDRAMPTVESFKWTQEERRRIQNYREGDILTFHQDFAGWRKHDSVSVVRIGASELVVRDAGGGERCLTPRRARGYSVGTATETVVAVGDRLLVRANVKVAGLCNGDLVEVAGFRNDGAIALRDGRVVPAWFREFGHGYAVTSHAAQGKTVDRGLLLMAEAGIAAGNLKQAYVSNSRFRESQMVYTSDKAAAKEALMRQSDRKLALELAEAEPEAGLSRRRSKRERWLARLSSVHQSAAA